MKHDMDTGGTIDRNDAISIPQARRFVNFRFDLHWTKVLLVGATCHREELLPISASGKQRDPVSHRQGAENPDLLLVSLLEAPSTAGSISIVSRARM
jgi:hypothetical protein